MEDIPLEKRLSHVRSLMLVSAQELELALQLVMAVGFQLPPRGFENERHRHRHHHAQLQLLRWD